VGPSWEAENIVKVSYRFCGCFGGYRVYGTFINRVFGLGLNLALLLNLVFIIALLSLLGATLTLAGIAVLCYCGISVDANVLIFERIREELRNAGSRRTASTRLR